jgi:hypothetical protein
MKENNVPNQKNEKKLDRVKIDGEIIHRTTPQELGH